MVRTLSLLAAVVLVTAMTGPMAGTVAADDEGVAATTMPAPTGIDAAPVGMQGAVTVPTDWTESHAVEAVAQEVLTTARMVDAPPPVLAPIVGASRFDDTEALAHETRKQLFEAVVDAPGIHLAGLAYAVNVPLSTVRYHSRVLQSEGLLETEKDRGYKRLFPATVDGVDRPLHTALASEAKRAVLLSVANTDPASVTNVARALDRAPSTVSHHLTQLESDGLVVRERDGETVVTRLVPSVRNELPDGT